MPASPSLLLVPARFKSGKLYTPVATTPGGLVLGASGDFNVTRATTATRFNSAGFIESVASGVPRLDYYTSGGTAGCPALLVETQAQNFILESAFVSGWLTGGGATASASVATSPENQNTAAQLNVTNTIFSTIYKTLSLVSGTVYTVSLFAKKNTKDWIYFINLSGVGTSVWFNIASGTIGTIGAGTSNVAIEDYRNGWYRCRWTQTATGSDNILQIGATDADNSNEPTSSGSVFLWGAQIEEGSIATSYIPTTAAAVTRNADVIALSGAVSGCIGQTQGTIYCEFAYFGQPAIRSGPVYLRQALARGLSINSDGNNGIVFDSRNDGGETLSTLVSGALQIGTYYKIAVGYNAGGTAAGGSQASGVVAYVNGTQTAIDTFRVPDAAGLTEFRMYGANAGADDEAFNGRIRAAALYTTRLTNAELAALTT
jgi:hypothetical protein